MERPDPVKEAIRKVTEGQHLDRHEARQVMDAIMEGRATHAQIGSLVTALKMKGETVDEITGFAESMRGKCRRVETERSGLLDTCGTGGDGARTFNISTAAAIVAAAGGVRTAKHGNRAMSSKSGSADVLEALGVNIVLNSVQAAQCLRHVGICFLFAQEYHQSMKYAAGPRREIGIRTVFNLLGPLTNPAGADRQLLGVFEPGRTETIAAVLRNLGLRRGLVVASHDGLDEISISAPTKMTELNGADIRTYDIAPEDLGLDRHPLSAVAGGTAEENADIIRRVFAGEKGAARDIVLANAGACFYVAGRAASLAEGVRLAADVVDGGLAARKLDQLISYTEALREDVS
jgi:anthranilate phosphoribosyltransferase